MVYAYESTVFSVILLLLFGTALFVFLTSSSEED